MSNRHSCVYAKKLVRDVKRDYLADKSLTKKRNLLLKQATSYLRVGECSKALTKAWGAHQLVEKSYRKAVSLTGLSGRRKRRRR